MSRETLLRDVDEYAVEMGLEDVHLLKKGALVAQDPMNYEDIEGDFALTEVEVTALRNEVLHKWSHPWALYSKLLESFPFARHN